MAATRTRSKCSSSELEIPEGCSYHGRTIFKHKGRYYYVSTGICSGIKGLVFPFLGVRKSDGWFIKNRNSGIEHYLTRGKRDEKYWDLSVKDIIYRFGSYNQIYVSYQVGHDFWLSPYGQRIAESCGFDPSLYATISIPKKIIPFTTVDEVRSWLRL